MSLYFEVKFCLVVTFCCNKTMQIHVIHCNIMGDEFWCKISALIYNFTREITKLPWEPSVCLSAKMVTKFYNFVNEDVRASKDALENRNT